MARSFHIIIRQFLFWILFFALNRAIFLIYHYKLIAIEGPGFGEVLSGFWHALRLDVSTAGYIIIIPFFLILLRSLINSGIFDIANKVYTFIIIVAYTLITTAELGIYSEWKTKLHYKALHYLAHPDEVYNTASTGQFFLLLIIFLILVSVSFVAFLKFFYRTNRPFKRNYIASAIFFLITPMLVFLGIRGGLQAVPITQSQSYYTSYNILNLAAINSGYSFTFSIIENYRFMKENPFQYFDDDIADGIYENVVHLEKDTTVNILNTERPNIVIILLESWSADLIYSLGGEAGITPEFEKLKDDGILFTEFYASGNRSEQAMSSIFGGFPATPITAITHTLDKVTKLPSLPERLKEEGYVTSFYFGGHLMYGGIKSYINITGIEHITEIYDFDDSYPKGKLGVHDEYVFDYQLDDLDKFDQPFFSTIFTLSTHSPYDQPMEKILEWGDNENEYINSAYYTDKCLGDYFRKAAGKSWYDNTLFVIMADHSHNSYRNWHVYSREYRHIPLLLYGNVIKEELRGSRIDRLSSQPDIPVTLLKQLGLETNEFKWSRDLLNPYTPEFAFYELDKGMGWIRPYGNVIWHKHFDIWEINAPEEKQTEIKREGLAYLQVLFREFIAY